MSVHAPTKNPALASYEMSSLLLKGHCQFGLFYTPSPLQLHTDCESDWAGNPDNRRSTSGYGVFSRQQPSFLELQETNHGLSFKY